MGPMCQQMGCLCLLIDVGGRGIVFFALQLKDEDDEIVILVFTMVEQKPC